MSYQDQGPSESERLMRAIAALSAAPDTMERPGRLLNGTTTVAGRLLDALLNEINETVLRRCLVFTNERGGQIDLDVSERRILSISKPAGQADQSEQLTGRALTADDSAACLSLLSDFCGDSDTLWVKTRPVIAKTGDAFDGVSWRDLDRYRSAASVANSIPATIRDALQKSKSLTQAGLCSKGLEHQDSWGAHDVIKKLSKLLPSLMAPNTGEELCVWQGGLKHDMAVVIAKRPESTDSDGGR